MFFRDIRIWNFRVWHPFLCPKMRDAHGVWKTQIYNHFGVPNLAHRTDHVWAVTKSPLMSIIPANMLSKWYMFDPHRPHVCLSNTHCTTAMGETWKTSPEMGVKRCKFQNFGLSHGFFEDRFWKSRTLPLLSRPPEPIRQNGWGTTLRGSHIGGGTVSSRIQRILWGSGRSGPFLALITPRPKNECR